MMDEVRVVPSGKVYRQIFDAEVQLVRTLGETRRKSLCHDIRFGNGRIPIVRNLDTPVGYILSQRRRSWMEGLMNDGYIENPVLRRDAVLSATKTKEVVELNNAVMEVKGLPDIIVPTKIGSSIIQQMTENKQKSHEAAMMKLEQELMIISRDLEKRFTEAAEQLLQYMEESHQNVHELLSRIEGDSDLPTLTFENLNDLWESIRKLSQLRRDRVKKLDETFKEYEKERVNQITAEFKDCMKTLEKIAYLPAGDIYRLIDKEAMLVNQALLANRRAMSKLYVNLIKADLKQEISVWQKWNTKVEDLKTYKKQDILWKLKDYLAKDWKAGLATEEDLLRKQQQGLNCQRKQLLEEIVNIKPSDCNKNSLDMWYESLTALNQEVDSLHIQFIDKLQTYYEKLYHEWMTEIEKCKEELLTSKTCTEKEAKQLMLSDFLPLHGNLQCRFEEELFAIDKHMENLAQETEFHCKELFNTLKKAALLWEEHEMNLTKLEDQLKEQLDDCRKKHDKANQAREANLDLLIDQLRQCNTQLELKADHKKAICLLNGIKKGYESFYQKQMKIVSKYPSTLRKELHRFSAAISNYFGVIEVYKPGESKIIIEPSKEDKKIFLTEDARYGASEDIMDESDENPSIREELLPNQLNLLEEQSEEETEHSEGELSPQMLDISLELDQKSNSSKESRNTSDQADWESSPHPSERFSEDGHGQEKAFFPEEKTVARQETHNNKKAVQLKYFVTSKGNTYSVLRKKKTKLNTTMITKLGENEELRSLLIYTKHALLPEAVFTDLEQRIRLNYFDHLEDWYDKGMENAKNVAVVKKKEFKAELELRTHLHEPRGKRIKMDVLHVRAAELRLHSEKVERHCNGVDEALKNLKKEFTEIQTAHCKSLLDFRNSIYNMEQIFKTATKSDRLVNLVNSLNSQQEKYMDGVNKLLRNFQQKLDKSLGKLQDDNTHFIKSLRLFAEGGNFTATEIDTYRQKVEQTTTKIAKTEGTIMVNLEVMGTLSVQQSSDVIKEVEDKYMRYTLDLIFIEKIKRFLTNTQTRIKSEVAKSNHQLVSVASHLEHFERKIDACSRPNLDKESVLPQDLYQFTKIIRDLMEKWAIYLNCLVEPVVTEVPLQGPIATATRCDFQKQDSKVTFSVNENLFQPSRKGRNAVEDVAVGVIKEILQTRKSKVVTEIPLEENDDQIKAAGSQISFVSGSQNVRSAGGSSRGQKTASSIPSAIKYTKPNRFDPKYEVFGETAEASEYYKGAITYILWESTNALLAVAEDYYKKKERTPVHRPEYLKDTFEQCAEEVIQKMQSYQSQAIDYYNNSLREFREQLLLFEQLLPAVPHFLMEEILKYHLEFITRAMAEKRSTFSKKQQQLESAKAGNKHRLRPVLGHPNNLKMLESLCKEEEERQDTDTTEIISNAESLKQCLYEHAKNFVSELSCLSEHLLLEFDNFLTIDDVQTPDLTESNEKTFTLSEQKQAGPRLQGKEKHCRLSGPEDQGGRSWPGIPANELLQIDTQSSIKESAVAGALPTGTATVTTAKTTLAHLATMEARDAAYLKYKQYFLQEMSQIEQETSGQLINAQRWAQGWKDSVMNIKKLYS
ncbi:coiled-coil domain-containing protein 180 [Pristis pectinata]|uniref:coiled-coil domain-containing protein 180 n=1 Tax=Pristis pectinata TaxID=685728 RepID=UPI00223D29EA|nr:coiled-coil domain-containing protein 180 [Pristis pectinata]